MKELNVSLIESPRAPVGPTLRDWAAVGFRRSRLILLTFLVVFGGVLLLTWSMPSQYESEAEILVKRERVDPIVTPDRNTPAVSQADVTEQDVNSEVELLKSHDLLEKVAVTSGLNTRIQHSRLGVLLASLRPSVPPDPAGQTVYAVQQLEKQLRIEPMKKTKMIKVTYWSTDPKLAATVLQNLIRLYLDKHL